jgi:hypothetical protein
MLLKRAQKWLNRDSATAQRKRRTGRRSAQLPFRAQLEVLEDRTLPSVTFYGSLSGAFNVQPDTALGSAGKTVAGTVEPNPGVARKPYKLPSTHPDRPSSILFSEGAAMSRILSNKVLAVMLALLCVGAFRGIASAGFIAVPPVTVTSLGHNFFHFRTHNEIQDAVAFPSGMGTYTNSGFSASIATGDTIRIRFEAPAGEQFAITHCAQAGVDESEPGKGYDAKAEQWKAKLPTTRPATRSPP